MLAETSALAALAALFVFKGLVPGWESLRSDFGNYYIVARLLREHYAMDRIYDWLWLQRIMDHWSMPQTYVGFVGLTPFSALPMLPLAWLNALDAKRVWLMANLVILAATLWGMHRITEVRMRLVALVASLAIIPFRNNFQLGQMHVAVLGLLVLAFWLYEQKLDTKCGLVLGVAASLKIYPLFFIFYFLRKRRWKPAIVLAGSTLAILAACFFIFGTPVMRVFLLEQLPRMLRGEAMDPFSLTSPSASSLFHRIFLKQPQVNPNPLFVSPLLFALLYPLWQLCLLGATSLAISVNRSSRRRACLEWAAWICLLLTLSTEPASYHRVALTFVAVLGLCAVESVRMRVILLVFYFVACNAHFAVPAHSLWLALAADFLPYWALVAMLACLLWALRSGSSESSESRAFAPPRALRPRTILAWGFGGFALVWVAAATATFKHVQSLSAQNDWAVNAEPVFARFAPQQASGHLLSVVMEHAGYRVEDEQGRWFQTGERGADEDQLAFASRPASDLVWIETAHLGHSRLVELLVRTEATGPAPIASIEDAESPALSNDGSRIVYLRETSGVGEAWIVSLDQDGRVLTKPAPVSPAGMDVRGAAFAGADTILLSAAVHGVERLFTEHLDTGLQRAFPDADSMDSPAAQSERSVLVRRQRQDGFWRLFASAERGSGSVQLTFGDCNAFDPAWRDRETLLYISDCGRGMGMGALAELRVETPLGTAENMTEIQAGPGKGDAQR